MIKTDKSEREAKRGNFRIHRGAPLICGPRCQRSIEKGDLTRIEIFYDDFGPFQAVTHLDCRDVKHRPRLNIPRERVFVERSGDIRRLIMSAQTEAAVNETETAETTATKGDTVAKKKKGTAKTTAKKKTKKTNKKKASADTAAPKAKAKKGAKKGAGKKGAKREGLGSMAATVASRLEIMKKNKKVSAILRAMSNGDTVKHKDLETLRDEVKATAQKLRDDGKNKQASELSSTNQLVRRLERAAR